MLSCLNCLTVSRVHWRCLGKIIDMLHLSSLLKSSSEFGIPKDQHPNKNYIAIIQLYHKKSKLYWRPTSVSDMISNILIRFVQKYPFFCWFPCVFFNRKKRQSIKILSTKTRNSRGPIGNVRKKSGPNFQCKLGVMWTVTWRTKNRFQFTRCFGFVGRLRRSRLPETNIFFAPEIYGFLKRKGLASFATNFQGRKC